MPSQVRLILDFCHDRPLNSRGIRNAPLMGAQAQALGILADALIANSALQARTTAEHFLDAMDQLQLSFV